MGMVHSGSPSVHTIIEESTSEDDSASSDDESSCFPIPRDCIVVTPAIPITTTPPPEETSALQTKPVVLQPTTVPRSNTGLLPEWLLAYQEEQQHAL
jgi:hypothetical protein